MITFPGYKLLNNIVFMTVNENKDCDYFYVIYD